LDLLIGMAHRQQFPALTERKPSKTFLSNMIFDGLIDEVRIYSRALSADEIMAARAANPPANLQPLQYRCSLQDAGCAAEVPKNPPPATPGSEPVYDLVVYGDSSGAVIAAVAAKREGHSVILVNPTGFPGGMSASGLGATDFLGKRGSFGGIASEFYDAIAAAYGTDYIRSFEPHVGRQVFEKLIADAGVPVIYNEKLDRTPGKGIKMDGRRIESITTLSGKTYRGKMFIDATYVGDLMAAAGVSYTVGRESESQLIPSSAFRSNGRRTIGNWITNCCCATSMRGMSGCRH